MSSLEVTTLRTAVANVITRRAGSGADASAVAAATRRTCDDLAVVLVPLISRTGVDALIDRALHLAKREYPSDPAGDDEAAEPFDQVRLWLERQDPARAVGAAAMMLATFAALLATLIGEPLTTRYLRKAWPDGFSDTKPEGTKP